MTDSSQPADSLETSNSNDVITITSINGCNEVTIPSFTASQLSTLSTIDVSSISYNTATTFTAPSYTGSTISITTGGGMPSYSIDGISDMFGSEWDTKFPDWSRVQKMCDEYPGLKIAFEKFKTVYKLVKEDYDTPKDKRVKP